MAEDVTERANELCDSMALWAGDDARINSNHGDLTVADLRALIALARSELAAQEVGRKAYEYYRASTCPCQAAERHVYDCPKHGTYAALASGNEG